MKTKAARKSAPRRTNPKGRPKQPYAPPPELYPTVNMRPHRPNETLEQLTAWKQEKLSSVDCRNQNSKSAHPHMEKCLNDTKF